MRTVANMLAAIQVIDITITAAESLELNIDEFARKNREQLYDGKKSDGQDLSPTYLEDPYFKTKEAAQRYSDWKDKITPNSKRKKTVPNLYINGAYYRSRSVQVTGDTIVYTATFKGAEMENKYGKEINGLGGEYKEVFIEETLSPTFKAKVEEQVNKK